MFGLIEADVEQTALVWLERLGWRAVNGPVIAPDGDDPERSSYDMVVLENRLRRSLVELISGELRIKDAERFLKERGL